MQSRVIFRDGMDNDPADHNTLQDFAQGAMDDLIFDAISGDRKYAGFVAAITSSTEITVQPGRLYSAGKVYARVDAFTKDFTNALPIATKKHVLVVVFGQESDTDARPREFLINEESGASEPRVVAMERARICNINTTAGQESPDPIDPVIDAGLVAVARVVLTPAGVSEIVMLKDNALDSIPILRDRLAAVEAFVTKAGPQIVALGSDMASLRAASADNVNSAAFGRLLVRMATLEERDGIPVGATDSDADFFLDKEESDLAHPNFLAKIEEGIRFADEAAQTSQLAVFDALNPRAKIVGDVLFPAYTRELRMSVGPRQAETQIASYSYQTHAMVQRMMSRQRVRYGEEFTVCTNAGWWGAVTDRYIPETFSRNGENFETVNVEWDGPAHGWVRVRRYWYDTVQEPYWDYTTVSHAVPGAQVAETFLNANAGWLDAVGLTFTKLAAVGGITLAICETDRGAPDLNKVISVTTVPRESMQLNRETVIPIQPAFLEGGVRYALVVISAADHWIATTQGTNFPQGTLFYVLDGAYQQGDGTRDLCFSLYMAKFAASRAVIDMQPLSLAGGMTAIDILAEAIAPKSTDLTYEVQVGGAWVPLAKTDQSILGAGGNIPPLVPLRLVLTGTPDVMPAVKLVGSRVLVSRPRTNLTHVSAVRPLPGAGSTQIRVIGRLEYFDAGHHTAACKLRTGAGYATIANPSSYADVVAEDGSIERTWVFNLGAAVTSYKIQFDATTDSALATFHFGWRKDYAL
jgi:hypothetical protein